MEEIKGYTFRPLTSEDLFPMFKLIGKLGVKDVKKCFANEEIKNMIISPSEGDVTAEVGLSIVLEIADLLFKRLPDCNVEIYGILASVSDIKESEIRKMSPADFFEMVVDFIKKPEFADFIKVVLKLFK